MRVYGLAGMLGVSLLATSASGAMIDEGTYKLCNHPDGNSNPPPYGLILTDLYDDKGKFTFDFDHDESQMSLTWDGDCIVIEGEVYGGRDIGTEWADDQYQGVYEVYFKYTLVEGVPGDDDLWVTDGSGSDGWIHTPLDDEIDLSSKSNGQYVFRLGDEDDNMGHRGWNADDDGFGVSGWGWLNHPGDGRPSDWLFTVKIPTPGSVALIAAAMPFVIRRRR